MIGIRRIKKIVTGTISKSRSSKKIKRKISPISRKRMGMARIKTKGNRINPRTVRAMMGRILITLNLHHKATRKNRTHPATETQNKTRKNMTARMTGNRTGETTRAIPQIAMRRKKEGAYRTPIKIAKGNKSHHPSVMINPNKI